MTTINLWLAFSVASMTEYALKASQGEDYTGTMDDQTFDAISTALDTDRATVRGLFKPAVLDGVTFILSSMYFEITAENQDALSHALSTYPDHIRAIGVWHMDGRQAGTEFTYSEPDEDGTVVTAGASGVPTYPIPDDAYLFMPDVITYGVENPDDPPSERRRVVDSVSVASSIADLRDVNLVGDQEPRRFT